jgi:DNA-binding SARP family transcriptional activator
MEKSEPLTNHSAVLALIESWLAEQQGRQQDSLQLLAKALAIAGTGNGWVRLRFHDATIRHMFAVAIEQNIEPEIAIELIRRFRLQPADIHLDLWPWPIRVRTLGKFEILLDGVALEFASRVPKKSLALLKLLVALGPKDVPEQQIIDALWPDHEGDAGHNALKITLMRLRRLLEDHDAVRQLGGKLSINRKRCWVDAWAFEHRLAQSGTHGQSATQELERALALYGGAFLPEDADVSWFMATRERLRAKYINAAVGLGGVLEVGGRYQEALTCYLKLLDADPLVERFYQGLIRCYGMLDRRSEAHYAYRRLKKMLAVHLGLAPAAATERLYQSICADGSGRAARQPAASHLAACRR